MQKGGAQKLAGRLPTKQEQYTEYKLRVPRNLVKRYNVMNLRTPRPVKIGEIKEAHMVRKTKKQLYVEDDNMSMPTFGAGSVYNYEQKEEARKKRRGFIAKEVNPDDLPYALRIGGKGGKRYTGRKEPILEHSAYYILTQCPDGVFEAVPVEAWYNFLPDIDYNTLTSDEVEQEFSKRDRTLSYFTTKYKLGSTQVDDIDSKIKQRDTDHDLIIHDDELIDGDDDQDFEDTNSDQEDKSNPKKQSKKSKNLFHGKKKKEAGGSDDNDSDEEEEGEFQESKEVDYMSETSSEDELAEMDDEPDPEKDAKSKAKDDLNLFSDSDDEQEETDLNEAGKELKAMLKKEAGNASSEDEEEEDEDIDKEYSKSALFMQGKDGKKKKGGKPSSNSGSKPGSRSSTPVQSESSEKVTQPAKVLKEAGTKRPHDKGSPQSTKKQRLAGHVSNSPLTLSDGSKSASRSGTPTEGAAVAITEDAIRRYLTHKPMTTTDLMRKFKVKKTGLSKEQTVTAIANILKKLQPEQKKVDGKLYLSLKAKK